VNGEIRASPWARGKKSEKERRFSTEEKKKGGDLLSSHLSGNTDSKGREIVVRPVPRGKKKRLATGGGQLLQPVVGGGVYSAEQAERRENMVRRKGRVEGPVGNTLSCYVEEGQDDEEMGRRGKRC